MLQTATGRPGLKISISAKTADARFPENAACRLQSRAFAPVRICPYGLNPGECAGQPLTTTTRRWSDRWCGLASPPVSC